MEKNEKEFVIWITNTIEYRINYIWFVYQSVLSVLYFIILNLCGIFIYILEKMVNSSSFDRATEKNEKEFLIWITNTFKIGKSCVWFVWSVFNILYSI